MSSGPTGFFEVVVTAEGKGDGASPSRETIEDDLADLLAECGLGEVSGSGEGSGAIIIDVDVFDGVRNDEAIAIVAARLRELDVPRGTRIEERLPSRRTIAVWESFQS